MTEFTYVNACCADADNREDGPGPRGGNPPDSATMTHCKVCDCRHVVVDADMFDLGLEVSAL